MADNGGKRKGASAGGRDQSKKKKVCPPGWPTTWQSRLDTNTTGGNQTGNAGKWKTPHQQAKVLSQEATLQPGDTGIWITCARHQESKAAREIEVLFAEVCLPPPSQA
jgi:hypothetical protein